MHCHLVEKRSLKPILKNLAPDHKPLWSSQLSQITELLYAELTAASTLMGILNSWYLEWHHPLLFKIVPGIAGQLASLLNTCQMLPVNLVTGNIQNVPLMCSKNASGRGEKVPWMRATANWPLTQPHTFLSLKTQACPLSETNTQALLIHLLRIKHNPQLNG